MKVRVWGDPGSDWPIEALERLMLNIRGGELHMDLSLREFNKMVLNGYLEDIDPETKELVLVETSPDHFVTHSTQKLENYVYKNG